jgi:2-oxoglutarate ferredoxin oxidoreductase subunit alpha
MSSGGFKSTVDFVVRIGGEAGEGVVSCGELFAQAAARTEYHVFSYPTYPAEIKGGFSMIQIRIRDWTVYSMGSRVDHLIVFNQQAYDKTIDDLRRGGTLIYDPDTVKVAEELDATKVAVPLDKIATRVTGSKLGKNVVALGVLGYVFDIGPAVLDKLIRDRYGLKGSVVVEKNLQALAAGYDAAKGTGIARDVHLGTKSDEKKARYMMLSGNEAVALGAIAAGCRFVAGYPITPATPIFETLTKLMPMVGGRAIQMEDEIASISAIIGASFCGQKVLAPTSGPGLQLMGEQLNLAAMLEVPIVIVNVQRGGPSTGLPTKTEQSDLKFAIYGTAGESPRAILAPTGVEDSFYQTIRAFNIAERFQMPVIVLTDQSIGYRRATVRIPALDRMQFVDPSVPPEKIVIPDPERIDIASRIEATEQDLAGYQRYSQTESGVSPVTRPGTPGGQFTATGLEHTESGRADYTPQVHMRMMEKRFRKLDVLSRALENNPPEYHGSPDAKIGIIGWGSTEGAIREARYLAEGKGIKIRHLHPRLLSPLPENRIRHFLVGLKQVIIVEENFTGQFAHFIKGKFGIRPIEIHKYQGIPITPEEIFRGIEKVARVVDEANITRL